MKLDFNNPKDKAVAVSNFTSLLQHPGWVLLDDIVKENMEVIRNQILDGTGESETKDFIDRLRDKLKIHKSIIETPRVMIEKLTPQEQGEEFEDDPYPINEAT